MSNHPKYQIWQPLLLSVLFALGMIVGVRMAPEMYQRDLTSDEIDANQSTKKIFEFLQYIDEHYVDTVSLSGLTDHMIREGVKALDPHSVYLDAAQYQNESLQQEGLYFGLGLEYFVFQDSLIISHVLESSPADSVGIVSLSVLLAVNDVSLTGAESLTEKINILRKAVGAPLTIEWLDPNGVLRVASIDPRSIEVSPIAYESSLDSIGYIKVRRFTKGTYPAFMRSLEELIEKDRVEDLIIDLRDNLGGFLQDAIQIISQFIPEKDKELLYTVGRDGRKKEYNSTGRNFFLVNDVVVLLNDQSASASEIVAGVLQDLNRATIVGDTSFGKGLVQQQFELSDGSAILLTTERYYTPSGRKIQKGYNQDPAIIKQSRPQSQNAGGIVPDIMVQSDWDRNPSGIQWYSFVYKNMKKHKFDIPNEDLFVEEIVDQLSTDDRLQGIDKLTLRKRIMDSYLRLQYGNAIALERSLTEDPYILAARNYLMNQ